MTGKKEENCIDTLLADLKTTIRLDLEDKDEEIPEDVFKGLVRKNGPVEAGNEVETAGSDRVGYVMEIVTTPPTPCTVNPPANDNLMMANHLAKQNHVTNHSLGCSLQQLRSNHSSPEQQSPPHSPPPRLTASSNHHTLPTNHSTNHPTNHPTNHSTNHSTQHSTKHSTKHREDNRRTSRSRHSESQSISSQCESHLSCESIGYDSDSSLESGTLKPRSSRPAFIQPINMQLHQSSNRVRDNGDASKPRSNGTVPGVGKSNGTVPCGRPSILRKSTEKDGTASETTSGVSSQDMKIRFVTSDSETQTEKDPSSDRSQTNLLETTAPDQLQTEPNQTIFHLDKYTHLTKRKRSKGIPNVCKWFGMSAVEHLIQNSVNMSSWVWAQNNTSACNSTSGSSTTLMKTCNPTPRTDRESPPSPPAPSAPLMFPPVREWDSEKSLFEAMSDIGEHLLEGLSPPSSRRGSRRGSQISLVDLISPAPDNKKKSKSGKRLGVPTKSDLANVKNSIIARCRSPSNHGNVMTPRTVKKNISNGHVTSKSDKKNVTSNHGNVMTSTLSNLSNSSDRSKEEEEEKKKEEDKNAAAKNATLLELLDEDGFGDENNCEEKKKSQRGKKSGGGGGGRYRGGNAMMKCAVLDEVVKQTRAEEEAVSEDLTRNGRMENHHGWRNAFRSEMRTKAFQDSHFEDVAQDLEKFKIR
ncbi:uncharacterized protein LOC134825650 isoform X2 [Bolinopsis microptera]|uniref:uncharacterized protein LOC134825650 isoform X2 n=1 Tax=Bolinopsis microptera TaxID=2820187 RepID=UPI00307A60E7